MCERSKDLLSSETLNDQRVDEARVAFHPANVLLDVNDLVGRIVVTGETVNVERIR